MMYAVTCTISTMEMERIRMTSYFKYLLMYNPFLSQKNGGINPRR